MMVIALEPASARHTAARTHCWADNGLYTKWLAWCDDAELATLADAYRGAVATENGLRDRYATLCRDIDAPAGLLDLSDKERAKAIHDRHALALERDALPLMVRDAIERRITAHLAWANRVYEVATADAAAAEAEHTEPSLKVHALHRRVNAVHKMDDQVAARERLADMEPERTDLLAIARRLEARFTERRSLARSVVKATQDAYGCVPWAGREREIRRVAEREAAGL